MRSFSSLMLVKGLNLIAPVVALPYILRTVGLENYGHVVFATVMAAFAGSIIQYGFSVTGVQAVAGAREDPDLLARTFWRNFLASALIGGAVVAVHIAIVLTVPSFRALWPLHFGAILLAAGNALVPHWLFLGLERSYYAAVSTVIVRFFHLFLLILIVRAPEDYILINIIGAGTAWLNVAITLAVIVGIFKLPRVHIEFAQILGSIREGFSSFLLQWTPNLYNSASILMLGFYVSPAALGAFSAANTVVTLVTSLGQLLANAFLPILSTSLDQHKTTSRIIMAVGLFVTFVTIAAAPLIATLLAQTEREIIIRDLYFLAAGIPFMFGYYAYSYNYVALIEEHRKASALNLAISISGLLLAFLLVPAFGSAGVAAVLFLARGIMFSVSHTIYRKHQSSMGLFPNQARSPCSRRE